MKKILQKESSILRKTAEVVPVSKITFPRIKKIIEEMKTALASQDDGVAIAAPQIGYSLRIFIVSKRVEAIIKKESSTQPERNQGNKEKAKATTDIIFINPIIKKLSKEKKVVEEGCLSVRYLYGKVTRSNKATIEAYDENAKKFRRGGSGLMAQIFQHEVDHLNGILFIDKAKYIEEIIPEKIKSDVTKRTSK